MLIDVHCHLDHCYFKDDLNRVIDNAKKANVKIILTAGINPETNRKVLEIAKKYDVVKPCLGIYPVQYNENNDRKTNDAKLINYDKKIKNNGNNNIGNKNNVKNNNLSKIDIDEEIDFIKKNKNKIVAIGEVGLDYFWIKDNINEQKKLFQRMILLAEKLNKPIIVHSRKAEQDCIEMLQSSKLKKIIMHCFSGKKSLVKKAVDNNWFLTAPTCIVKSAQFQENVKLTPITQLFCETDAPYLSPFSNKRNEPALVIESYKKLAEIKDMELKEVINNIWMNWQKVF